MINTKQNNWNKRTHSKNFAIPLTFVLLFAIAVIYGNLIYAPCDDSYIFYVYVKNFLAGKGLTYNGTLVEGFSSILWITLLTIIGFITKIELPLLGESLSILSGFFALFTTYILAKKVNINSSLVLFPCLLLVLTGDFAFYMSIGLEQVLFTGFLTLSTALIYSPSPKKLLQSYSFPFLLAILITVRYEGILLSVVMLSILAFRSNSLAPAIKCGLLITLFLAPVFIAKWIYYGYLLPNTYYVKSNFGMQNLQHGWEYISGAYLRFFVIFITLLSLVWWGLFKNYTSTFRNTLPLLIISSVWIFYVIIRGGDNMIAGRFILPILPLVYVLLVRFFVNVKLGSKSIAFLTIFVALTLVLGYIYDPIIKDRTSQWNDRYTKRKSTGIYLKENFPSNTLVALNAAGIIPYYSEMPTIDMLGLNNVYIAHYGKRDLNLRYGHQAGDGNYVLSQNPDIIIFRLDKNIKPIYVGDHEIYNSTQFKQNYELKLLHEIECYVYIKKDN